MSENEVTQPDDEAEAPVEMTVPADTLVDAFWSEFKSYAQGTLSSTRGHWFGSVYALHQLVFKGMELLRRMKALNGAQKKFILTQAIIRAYNAWDPVPGNWDNAVVGQCADDMVELYYKLSPDRWKF